MPQGPAARLSDNTAHGAPLAPGPGSPNVLIGNQPAWRAIPTGAAAGLISAKASATATLATLAATTVSAAAAIPPVALPGAQAAEVAGRAAALSAMSAAITSAAAGADTHTCSIPFAAAPPEMPPSPTPPGPTHGPGVVINGSVTVMINNLPAARQGDSILEALGPMDSVAKGEPTVIIGG